MSDVDTDAETIEDLDWEPEMACQVTWKLVPLTCGKPADGLIRCRHCGFSIMASDECWTRSQHAFAKRSLVSCRHCGRVSTPVEAFEFIPIGKK